jgi:hypothetical protein
MVRDELARFGDHVDKQVSYKIFQLKVPKNAPFLCNLPVLIENIPRSLGVNDFIKITKIKNF